MQEDEPAVCASFLGHVCPPLRSIWLHRRDTSPTLEAAGLNGSKCAEILLVLLLAGRGLAPAHGTTSQHLKRHRSSFDSAPARLTFLLLNTVKLQSRVAFSAERREPELTHFTRRQEVGPLTPTRTLGPIWSWVFFSFKDPGRQLGEYPYNPHFYFLVRVSSSRKLVSSE